MSRSWLFASLSARWLMNETLRARWSVAAIFFVNGAIFATWASRIPAIVTQLSMDSGELAVAVLGLSVGAVLGLPLATALVSRYGSPRVVRIALIGYAVALVGVALAANEPALTVALVGLGVGNGVLDVAMNAAGVRVERDYPRQIMSAFHALFSVGGLVGSLVGAGAAALNAAVAVHLPVVGLTLLATGLIAGRNLLPEPPRIAVASQGSVLFGPRRWNRRLTALGLLACGSLLCEGVAYDWSAVYLRDNFGAATSAAALGFAAFSLCMAAGRLVADRLVARISAVRFVRAAGLVATAGSALVVLSTSATAATAGFGLLGLGLAGVVPTLFSVAAQGHDSAASAIATVSALGYIGFVAGPVLVGAVASALGLRVALGALVVLTAVLTAGAGALQNNLDVAAK